MKDGLENIDEIFKQKFDGFESNVDPSVWNNVQNSISSGSGGSSTPQVDPSAVSGFAGKSLAVKIVAGVALVGTVATSAYFIPDLFEDQENTISENIIAEDESIEIASETILPIVEEKNEEAVDDNDVIAEETTDNVVNNNVTVETNKLERKVNPSTEVENTNEAVVNTNSQVNSESSSDNSNPTQTKSNVTSTTENTIKVVKTPKLSVSINVDVIKGKAPLTVQFDGWGENVKQYFWDFSDGTDDDNGESPVHTFIKEGTYRVRLTGQDKMGNTKAAYTTIIVEKDHSSSIQKLPNVFTPNGDGQNDFIKVRGKNIDGVQVRIMDSKGNIVYQINSLDDKWEGKDQSGNYLIQGQYLMMGVAIGKDDERHVIKQVVNLLK